VTKKHQKRRTRPDLGCSAVGRKEGLLRLRIDYETMTRLT
jgi:hypothetical protein